MAKHKTRKEKESAVLRREVEALRLELKRYQKDEAPKQAPKHQVAQENPQSLDRLGTSLRSLSTPSNSFEFTRKDLRKTAVASAVCLAALAGFYLLLPHQDRLLGFFRFGDFKHLPNWNPF